MGRIDVDPSLVHFSHPHVLAPIIFQSQPTKEILCAGCKLPASGLMYHCSACNFYLHKACSLMPRTKSHPLHPKHELTLHPIPAYPEGSFECNACGEQGTGFCYRCEDCDVDVHSLCAYMPVSVNTNSHHVHALGLFASPPYQKKAFKCDICKGYGLDHGLYRCSECNFDAHLKCALADLRSNSASRVVQQRQLQQRNPPHPIMMQQLSSPTTMIPGQLWHPSFAPNVMFHAPESSNPFAQMNESSGGVPVIILPQYVQPQRTGDSFAELMMREYMKVVSQQAGLVLLQSTFGGFGGLGGLGGFGGLGGLGALGGGLGGLGALGGGLGGLGALGSLGTLGGLGGFGFF